MDKLTAIKIKYQDGTYSQQIPISALASNIEWDEDNSLVDVIGTINTDPITGDIEPIQDQINSLSSDKADASYVNTEIARVEGLTEDKVSDSQMSQYVDPKVSNLQSQINNKITNTQMQTYVDGQITSVRTEISSLAADDIAFDSSTSVLDSTNVQDAIDEVTQMANKTIDTAMSSTSTNAVQNKIIKAYVDAHEVATDTSMSDSSTNPVQNKIIKAYVDTKVADVDSAMSDSSTKPVQNKVIKAYVDNHQVQTDTSMSDSSTNPVQNKTIKAYVDTPTFTQAASRENINSGDTRSTLFGKIKKYFSDLKSVAFSGSYNDLMNKPTSQNPAQGGTQVSLVTTGEKYRWDHKTSAIELTQAEYDALTPEQKMNGTAYYITDGGVGLILASDALYDNTESGLTSTNLQDAVDEISSNISQAAFEIVIENNEYVLYWHGVQSECPYEITFENGEYILNFVYTSAS